MDQGQYQAIYEHFTAYYRVFDTNRSELAQYYHVSREIKIKLQTTPKN